jgi:hypothetical protein
MGVAWTSGVNLYATIAILGLAGSAGMIQLPPDLLVLTNPLLIGVACIMYCIEFFADKVPYVDHGWDALHTFIRIPAGALLAARSVGHLDPTLELAALLAGGTVALAAHGTKATARLAVNTSPEPFSNWFVSVSEDIAVLGGMWLVFHHPVVMLFLVLGFTACAVWLIPKFLCWARRGLRALRARFGRKRVLPLNQQPSIVDHQLQ